MRATTTSTAAGRRRVTGRAAVGAPVRARALPHRHIDLLRVSSSLCRG
jgi:hypothetical protein